MKEIDVWTLGSNGTMRAELSENGWLYLENVGVHPTNRMALCPAEWVDLATLLSGFVVGAAKEIGRETMQADIKAAAK